MGKYRWQVWVIKGDREWCRWLCLSREQAMAIIDDYWDSQEYDAAYVREGEYRG